MQQLVRDQMVYCYFVVEEMQPVWYVFRICTRLHILMCHVVWMCHDRILVLIQWQVVQPHKLIPNHDLNCGCQIYQWLSNVTAQKSPFYFFLSYELIWTIQYHTDQIWLLSECVFVLKNGTYYILYVFLQPLDSAYGLAKHRDGRWEWAVAPGISPSPRYQHAAVSLVAFGSIY